MPRGWTCSMAAAPFAARPVSVTASQQPGRACSMAVVFPAVRPTLVQPCAHMQLQQSAVASLAVLPPPTPGLPPRPMAAVSPRRDPKERGSASPAHPAPRESPREAGVSSPPPAPPPPPSGSRQNRQTSRVKHSQHQQGWGGGSRSRARSRAAIAETAKAAGTTALSAPLVQLSLCSCSSRSSRSSCSSSSSSTFSLRTLAADGLAAAVVFELRRLSGPMADATWRLWPGGRSRRAIAPASTPVAGWLRTCSPHTLSAPPHPPTGEPRGQGL
jgi:hypothetical protein